MEKRTFKSLLAFLGLAVVCITFYFALLRFDVIVAGYHAVVKILTPITYGVIMAYLLNPVMRVVQPRVTAFLAKRMKSQERAASIGKGVGITAAILFGIAAVTVVCLMIMPELYRSIKGLIAVLPGQITAFITRVEQELEMNADWQAMADLALQKVLGMIENFSQNGLLDVANNFLGYLMTSVIGMFKFVFNLFIGVMTAIFALSSKETFIAQAKKLLFACLKPEHANNVLDVARFGHRTFGGFLIGKIIDSLIIGVICYVCMVLMKMPYAVLIGIFVGLTNIVPTFGPFFGAIPSAILILLVDPIKAVYFLIFILILQQIDGNIIGPTILGDTTGLSEFWVIVSLMFCGGLWGVGGLIIGVPLFATLYYVAKRGVERVLRNKGLPVATTEYRDVNRYDRGTQEFVMGIDETLKQEKEEKKRRKKARKQKVRTGETGPAHEEGSADEKPKQ